MRMRDNIHGGCGTKYVGSCLVMHSSGYKKASLCLVVVRYIYTMISGTRAVRRLVPISRRGLLVNGWRQQISGAGKAKNSGSLLLVCWELGSAQNDP